MMTVRATLFPYLSIIWDKIYASMAEFMMMTTFHASFFAYTKRCKQYKHYR